MDEVEVTILTEDDFFQLDSCVDRLQETSNFFKDTGVLLFRAAEGSGEGTTAEDFLTKFEDKLKNSISRLNPIRAPQSNDFYGHMSFNQELLDPEEVLPCSAILGHPAEYLESPDNCCISALNEGGKSGLLSHYFEKELPAQASHPPQYRRMQSIGNLRKRAESKSKTYMKMKMKLDSMTTAEKACALSKELKSPKSRRKAVPNPCSCSMCVYSDEILVEEDGSEIKPETKRTAKFYEGQGFMYANGVNVETHKHNMISSNFSLSFLNRLTMTCLLEGFFPGINSPYLYFGFIHSFFPIHIEDLSLWSINFLHHGYPKLWVVVPPSAVAKLHYFLSKEFTCSGHGSCIGLLGHKYHLPTPLWLRNNGIPFKVVVQKSGHGVIVAPNAAHFGFNLGPNIAEAINFASKSWIPYGIVYPKCTCMIGQVHADLSTIISTFFPDMLEAYLHQKIPRVETQPYFHKCIVHPYLWKESFQNTGAAEQLEPSNDIDDGSDAESDNCSELVKKLKRCPKRKVIMCPLCNQVYQGGQRQRLYDHINTAHPNLSEQESNRVQSVLSDMFPQRGTKLPKRICSRCGKAVARSMNAHQKSIGCKPKGQGSNV